MTSGMDERPWGFYVVLADEKSYKCKKIVVRPGKRLSLQRHQRRDEHWFIVNGEAEVTMDKRYIKLRQADSINIPRGSFHRVKNCGAEDLWLIEVQTGDYFGEDDIERIEDDFGRV